MTAIFLYIFLSASHVLFSKFKIFQKFGSIRCSILEARFNSSLTFGSSVRLEFDFWKFGLVRVWKRWFVYISKQNCLTGGTRTQVFAIWEFPADKLFVIWHKLLFFLFFNCLVNKKCKKYYKNKKNFSRFPLFSCVLGGKPATSLPAAKQLTKEGERETKANDSRAPKTRVKK